MTSEQTNRQTDKQTNKQTNRQAKQTGRRVHWIHYRRLKRTSAQSLRLFFRSFSLSRRISSSNRYPEQTTSQKKELLVSYSFSFSVLHVVYKMPYCHSPASELVGYFISCLELFLPTAHVTCILVSALSKLHHFRIFWTSLTFANFLT